MNHRLARWRLGLLLPALALAGCGTGEYERRLKNRISEGSSLDAAAGNPQPGVIAGANELYAASALPGTQVWIRVPQVFKPINEQQDRPPLADLRQIDVPGCWKVTYEAFITDQVGGQIPYYCSLGDIDLKKSPGANKKVLDNIQKKAKAAWTTVTLGGKPWQKLRVQREKQVFACLTKDKKSTPSEMPAIAEIYAHEAPNHLVLMMWTLPDSIKDNVQLPKWAPLVGGSVEVK